MPEIINGEDRTIAHTTGDNFAIKLTALAFRDDVRVDVDLEEAGEVRSGSKILPSLGQALEFQGNVLRQLAAA